MLGSLQVLRTSGIPIKCTSFSRLCMCLSRRRRLGMLDLSHFC
jgi:hypothetical protein